MLKDEFEHLLDLIRQGAEGKAVNLHEVFSESMTFFQHFKEEFERASPEEKKDLMQMMMAMNKEIMQESQKILKNSGMSEEQLVAFAENPSNFTPEQWKDFQESKAGIHKAGMELFKEVHKTLPGTPPVKPHTVQPISKKEPGGPKKPHKTDWKRS
jgi:hypothetical protein